MVYYLFAKYSSSNIEDAEQALSARKRYQWVNLLNVIACIAVIALHVTLNVFTPERSRAWLTSLIIHALCIFATPIFFMISGMNLLNYRKRYSTKDFFLKRLKRVGVALICASLLCYLLFGLFPHSFYNCDSYLTAFGPIDFLERFFSNSINDIYWFLYSIIYLYLLTPLLSLAVSNKRTMTYLLALTGFSCFVIPLLQQLGVSNTYLNPLFGWSAFSYTPLFYYLAGGYIGNHVPMPVAPNKKRTLFLAALFVLSFSGMVVIGLAANGAFGPQMSNKFVDFPTSTASPLCALETLSLFLLARQLDQFLQGEAIGALLTRLSKLSFNVYLIHNLFLLWQAPVELQGFFASLSRHPLIKIALAYALSLAACSIYAFLKELPRRLFSPQTAN